jgi:hypothetical protein
MLNYLLAHPEFSFSPREVADLCEAFDMAVAVLQGRENASASCAADSARAALAAEIVEAWVRGEKDPACLSDQAVRTADSMFAGGRASKVAPFVRSVGNISRSCVYLSAWSYTAPNQPRVARNPSNTKALIVPKSPKPST